MPNGTGLTGHFSSSQGALIIPKPGSNLLYYVFTLTEYGSNINLYCSVVDMSLDNGFGDVTQLNILIADSMSEKQIAVRHANGMDFWLITHNRYNNEFQSFLISSSNISTTPARSNIGSSILNMQSVGCMKASRSGNKIACAYWSATGFFEMYDFNKSTGLVSNDHKWQHPDAYSVEFSPDENYFYGCVYNAQKLYQFNVLAPANPGQLIYTGNYGYGDLLLGPDGKIYINLRNNNYLGVINYPDSSGTSCGYVENGYNLGTTNGSIGLPNMIHDLITITDINDPSGSSGITILQNVVQDVLTIYAGNLNQQIYLIELYNTYGQMIKVLHSGKLMSGPLNKTFDVSNLSKGVYFVIINKNSSSCERIIKL